jgi:hypothetical protein
VGILTPSVTAELFLDKYQMTARTLYYNIILLINGFSLFASELLTEGIIAGFYAIINIRVYFVSGSG